MAKISTTGFIARLAFAFVACAAITVAMSNIVHAQPAPQEDQRHPWMSTNSPYPKLNAEQQEELRKSQAMYMRGSSQSVTGCSSFGPAGVGCEQSPLKADVLK